MLKKLIILNGPPDSGKDTVADYIANKYGYTKLEMKGALRKFAHTIVTLTGGDKALCDSLEYNRELKDTKRVPEFGDRTWPEFLIWLSESVAKPIFGNDVFARAAIKAVYDSNATHVVFSDGGFPVEADALWREFGDLEVIHVYREGRGFGTGRKDSRRYIEHPDANRGHFRLENTSGLAQLMLKVDGIVSIIDTDTYNEVLG